MQYGTLVRKALEEKKYHQEALRQQTITEVFAVLERLSQRVTFDQAFLFGSLVRPYTFYDHSDIDIGFVNLHDDQIFWVIAFLSRQLGRDVDVVQLEKAGRIRAKILQEGIPWMKKNSVS
jgi:predicted nucleotidyltransferase